MSGFHFDERATEALRESRTPNHELLQAALRVWKLGQRPGTSLDDQIAIDDVLKQFESLWTEAEKIIAKNATRRFRLAGE